jgi:hypothetical protein
MHALGLPGRDLDGCGSGTTCSIVSDGDMLVMETQMPGCCATTTTRTIALSDIASAEVFLG